MLAAGIDIGGTKCAVCLGEVSGEEYRILHRCPPRKTKDYAPAEMLNALCGDLLSLKQLPDAGKMVERIGISCGGPLDSRAGVILSPPNLPAGIMSRLRIISRNRPDGKRRFATTQMPARLRNGGSGQEKAVRTCSF